MKKKHLNEEKKFKLACGKGSTKSPHFIKNEIFNELHALPELNLQEEDAQKYVNDLISIDSQILKNRISLFKNLKSILLQVLLNKPVSPAIFASLTPLERLLFETFFRKKFGFNEQIPINLDLVNSINNYSKCKRFEENIKFVFLKGIKFLEKIFHRKLYSLLRSSLSPKYKDLSEYQKIEYAFYGYYFGHLINEVNHPIEAFFRPRYLLPKNPGKTGPLQFPKTVSKVYINLIKLSKRFTQDFMYYLKNYFACEMESALRHKTNQMVSDWETLFFAKGEEGLRKHLQSKLGPKSKSKLIWSLRETQVASDELQTVFK